MPVQSEHPMTIQLKTPWGLSKKSLQEKLNADPSAVTFYNPSVVKEGHFTGAQVSDGERFVIVLNHPKRTRFAGVQRLSVNDWKVY